LLRLCQSRRVRIEPANWLAEGFRACDLGEGATVDEATIQTPQTIAPKLLEQGRKKPLT
jgi:hypothetical protein